MLTHRTVLKETGHGRVAHNWLLLGFSPMGVAKGRSSTDTGKLGATALLALPRPSYGLPRLDSSLIGQCAEHGSPAEPYALPRSGRCRRCEVAGLSCLGRFSLHKAVIECKPVPAGLTATIYYLPRSDYRLCKVSSMYNVNEELE